jgi:hypothetical protein
MEAEQTQPNQGSQIPPTQPPAEAAPAVAGQETPPATTTDPAQTAAPAAEAAIPAPESHFAELYTLGALPDQERLDKGVALVYGHEKLDRTAHTVLMNSMYAAHEDEYRNWVLEDLGITADKAKQFVDWAKSGSPDLPSLPQAATFPEWDAEGMVKLPDGRVLDRNDPDDLDRYENAKYRFENERREAVRAAEERRNNEARAQKERNDREQAVIAQQEQRTNEYITGRTTLIDSLVKPAIANLAEEDKWLGDLLLHGAHRMMYEHPEVTRIGSEASQHVLDGDGRVAEFAAKQDNIIRTEINKLIAKFNDKILRGNKAERALTVKDPVIPGSQSQTVTAATPPSPETTPPQTRDDLYRRGLAKVGARMDQLPVTGR